MKIIVTILFLVVLSILFFVFYKPQLRIEFRVTHVNTDTTFQNPVWKGSDGYGIPISLRAIGELDNKTELFIRDPNFPDKFFVTKLPKGPFDITCKGEYYAEKAEIVFLHKKAKKGNIRVIFSYLAADADTLTEQGK